MNLFSLLTEDMKVVLRSHIDHQSVILEHFEHWGFWCIAIQERIAHWLSNFECIQLNYSTLALFIIVFAFKEAQTSFADK